jgi:hypothetical protein
VPVPTSISAMTKVTMHANRNAFILSYLLSRIAHALQVRTKNTVVWLTAQTSKF